MGLRIEEILVQIIGFIILLWLLKKLIWDPFLNMLDERRELVANEFHSIEEAKRELSSLKGVYESKIAEIDRQVQARLREKMEQGNKIAKEVFSEARKKTIRIIKEERLEIRKEMEKTLKELEPSIENLSIIIASRVIGRPLRKEDHLVIINDLVTQYKYSEQSFVN